MIVHEEAGKRRKDGSLPPHKTRWEKVGFSSVWGRYTWFYGKQDRSRTIYSENVKRKAIAVLVQWPNGFESFENIYEKIVYIRIFDHGADVSCHSTELCIKVDLNGVEIPIRLDNFSIDPTTIVWKKNDEAYYALKCAKARKK